MTASSTAAEPKRHFSEALPPDAILTNVQLSGLNPTSRPYKRGPYYVRVVAEPGERSSLDDSDEAALPDEGVERYAPPHHHRVVPRRAQRGVRRR